MFGASGRGASSLTSGREVFGSHAEDTAPTRDGRRRLLTWCGALAVSIALYALSFGAAHRLLGNPAFLIGLGICIAGGAALGVRGALVVIACVALVDRSSALSLPAAYETGRAAAVISLLVKLVLAGAVGMLVDSRRRERKLNGELRREIEARKRSEEWLQHSERTQRALVESLGEGVGLFDAEDRIVFANHALGATLGVTREELTNRIFAEFLTEESRGSLPATPSASGRRSYEVVLERKPELLLLVTETHLDADGSHDRMTIRVVRDLTDRVVTERRQRDLERELQRSQALQSLAVLAGGVAHDFNNLLCGVVGNAEVALMKVPSDAPPLLSRCLTEVMSFAGEAAQLSKQMLAYAGRRSLAIQALELNTELSSALRLLHATVESKAQLVLELSEQLPEVSADRFQLRQVVTNLVLNALDAMNGKRGTLTLRTSSVRLDASRGDPYGLPPGHYVQLTVSDTGTGIRDEIRERLFEPFYSTKGAGRGMGLAAAAGIVRAHRGWLGVDATSPEGTSFSVLLPIANETTPRQTSSPPPPSTGSVRRSILLIDDEPAVRLVTGRMLSELGHRVLTADSGRRGVELLRTQPNGIDLVVLDLTMPEQSGEQTLAQLREVRGNLPIVITSGFHADDASALLQIPSVVGFLDKPHTLSSLELLLSSIRQTPRVVESRPVAP